MVALPATRSVRALARARSMFGQAPWVRYWWARASIAAQAWAASSEGKVPTHLSTPGSSAHRRSPHSSRARRARWTSRSGLTRVSTRRQRRRRCAASSDPKYPSRAATTVAATCGGASTSSAAIDPGPVAVQGAGGHRGVQPTQPGRGAGAGRAVGGQGQRGPHPGLGVHRGHVQHPGHDGRGVQRGVPQRPVGLDDGAVLEHRGLDRGHPHDHGVLDRAGGVDHLLQRPQHPGPLRQRPAHLRGREGPGQLTEHRLTHRLHLHRTRTHHHHPLRLSVPQTLRDH